MPADTSDVRGLLDRICDLIAERIDPQAVAAAKRRHADMLAWRPSDYIPMAAARSVPQAAGLPDFNWAEQWHDPAKSLYTQLKDVVLPRVAAGGDYVPGVRADTGVINCMTVFGVGYDVPAHTRPVVTRYVAKEALAEFEVPADVSRCGILPHVREHMVHHLAALRDRGLGELVSVYHCDQQGPFDIAAMVRGHDIFTDLYEDGEFVHALMDKCTDVYVAVSRLCKRLSGEPPDGGNAVGVWMANGGVRMCGDSDILIGADMHRRFVLPYQRRALGAFGGGWMHYCGGMPGTGRAEGLHLHEVYAENEHLRGLNWTTGGDWLGEMKRLRTLGVVHLGGLPRRDGEPLEAYFRRALSPYDQRVGMVFGMPMQDASLRPDEFDGAMDTWRRVQDELFPGA